jgi:hypothetical protein
MRFHGDLYSADRRFDENADSLRLGLKQQLSSRDVLLSSFIVQDLESSVDAGPLFGIGTDQKGYALEAQHIRKAEILTVQSGVVAAKQDETDRIRSSLPGFGASSSEFTDEMQRFGLYSYVHFSPADALALTVGFSVDDIDGMFVDRDAINPKLGLAWRATTRTTVRASAFETLFGSLTTSVQNAQPGLEPVQIAGFTQLLFGGAADQAQVRGVAIDHEWSPRLFVGWQAEVRETDRTAVSVLDPQSGPTAQALFEEHTQQAYLYWTPIDRVSLSARYEHGRYQSAPVPLFGYTDMKLDRLPLELRYFARGGLTAGVRASRIAQSGVFETPAPPPPPTGTPQPGPLGPSLAPGSDRFWIFDAFVGYRLPQRRGLLSLNADNLLDERFHFQDVDPSDSSLIPERMLSVRFTLAFD